MRLTNKGLIINVGSQGGSLGDGKLLGQWRFRMFGSLNVSSSIERQIHNKPQLVVHLELTGSSGDLR